VRVLFLLFYKVVVLLRHFVAVGVFLFEVMVFALKLLKVVFHLTHLGLSL